MLKKYMLKYLSTKDMMSANNSHCSGEKNLYKHTENKEQNNTVKLLTSREFR